MFLLPVPKKLVATFFPLPWNPCGLNKQPASSKQSALSVCTILWLTAIKISQMASLVDFSTSEATFQNSGAVGETSHFFHNVSPFVFKARMLSVSVSSSPLHIKQAALLYFFKIFCFWITFIYFWCPQPSTLNEKSNLARTGALKETDIGMYQGSQQSATSVMSVIFFFFCKFLIPCHYNETIQQYREDMSDMSVMMVNQFSLVHSSFSSINIFRVCKNSIFYV